MSLHDFPFTPARNRGVLSSQKPSPDHREIGRQSFHRGEYLELLPWETKIVS